MLIFENCYIIYLFYFNSEEGAELASYFEIAHLIKQQVVYSKSCNPEAHKSQKLPYHKHESPSISISTSISLFGFWLEIFL